MTMRALTVSLIVLGAAMSPAQGTDAEGVRLLRRVQAAADSVAFTGVRALTGREGGELRTIRERIWRRGNRLRIEFLEPTALRGHVAVEDGTMRRVFAPARNEIRIQPAQEGEGFRRLSRLLAKSRRIAVKVSDGGRIAGLPTRLVTILGPGGAVRQKLWIEPRSAVVLRTEALDAAGGVAASFAFAEINLEAAPDAAMFELNAPGATMIRPIDDLRRMSRALGMPAFSMREDNGWKLVGVKKLGAPKLKALMQTYANGGDRVTLFLVADRAVNPDRLRGLVGEDLNSHTWEAGKIRLVLISEMDESALKRLAQRVEA